jgi:oligosaccharide repeat unit polymerase
MFGLKFNIFQKSIILLFSFSFSLNMVLREFEFLPYYKFDVVYFHVFIYFVLVILLASVFRFVNTSYITSLVLKIRINRLSEAFLIFTATVLILAYVFAMPVYYSVLDYSAKDLKELMFLDYARFPIYQSIPLGLIGYFSYSFVLFHILYFLSFVKPTKFSCSRLLYLLASLAGIFNEILVGGRTMFIYWLMSFLTMYIFFSVNLRGYAQIKNVRKRLLIILLPLLFYFVIISIDRFSASYSGETEFDTLVSLVEYGGMGYYQFSNYLSTFNHSTNTFGRVFPIFYDLINDEKFDLLKYRKSVNVDLSVFSTMFGDLYVDLGIFGIIAFLLFIFFIFLFTRKLKLFSLFKVFIFFQIFNICIQGMFYFSYWNKSSRIGFYISLIIIFVVGLINNYGISNNRKL